jgi:hypothetical protein
MEVSSRQSDAMKIAFESISLRYLVRAIGLKGLLRANSSHMFLVALSTPVIEPAHV